jgi:hypothetical protein
VPAWTAKIAAALRGKRKILVVDDAGGYAGRRLAQICALFVN